MLQRPTLTAAALLTASFTLVGCGSSWLASKDNPQTGMQPNDFIGESHSSTPTDEPENTLVTTDAQDTPTNETPAPTNTPRTDMAFPIDAMVGHINGEAVYVDQIFDINLVAQLESFGRRFDSEEFRNYAGNVIQDRLQGVIINKLILGEAERSLKEAQRRGIEGRIIAEREELLRYYGQGSLAKAKAEFLKERGKELEQHLADFREELVIGSYIRSKVLPKIVVNQRDVERYYADNKDRYHQPDQRVIRLIRAMDESATNEAQRRLSKSEAFDRVASDPQINRYNPENAGIFNGGKPVAGNKIIGIEPVNDALLSLQVGEYAGPIKVGESSFFVLVVELTPGVKIPLADAQIEIERILRSTQFERHALSFRMDLLKRGSYSDPAEMGNKLVDIAAARYDQ